jgi:cytochrome P450
LLIVLRKDTTASTLTWLFYELAQNPRIFNKLRTEILTTVGLFNPPTYDDLKNMRYLQNTISETLRLYPTVPFNVRHTLRPSSLPQGGVGPPQDPESKQRPIGVRPGTIVAYSTFLLHRNPALYPAVSPTFAPVETFSPERWENWTPRPWQFIPFSGGPRICLGQNFALTEVGYTVARMLQRFSHIELAASSNAGGPVLIPDIVLQPGNPVLVRLFPREA